MKTHSIVLSIVVWCTLSSFNFNQACEYAGSNINYIKKQTEKAIEAQDLAMSKFYAYKALNAIEKSEKQFEACGCDYASKSINEGLENIKKATKGTTLKSAQLLLKRALIYLMDSLNAIQEHEIHKSKYSNEVLTMNTIVTKPHKLAMKLPEERLLHKKIDQSLVSFEQSLNKVVNSVDCNRAYAFTEKIYKNCEQQLLKNNLTEAKKYYNLRTKEIAEKALEKLKGCQ